MLIVLGGLPGVGKTTVARELARRLGAVHIRIDSIEGAIRESGVTVASLDDAGYRVGYALAEDNLAVGRVVIADSVNPLPETRAAWLAAASRARVPAIEVEVVCSDPLEHRRRVEERRRRTGDHAPTWNDVASRDYRPWSGRPLRVDTARHSVVEIVETLRTVLSVP